MNADVTLTMEQAVDLTLVALTIYREASNQPYEAKLAVAFVILTRVKLGGWWGSSFADVVTHPAQFSSMTIKGDPNTVRYPQLPATNNQAWQDCLSVALEVITSPSVENPTPGADSYYDISIPPPSWTSTAKFCGALGAFRFYQTRLANPA